MTPEEYLKEIEKKYGSRKERLDRMKKTILAYCDEILKELPDLPKDIDPYNVKIRGDSELEFYQAVELAIEELTNQGWLVHYANKKHKIMGARRRFEVIVINLPEYSSATWEEDEVEEDDDT